MSSARRSVKIRALVVTAVATVGLAVGAVATSGEISIAGHSLGHSLSISAGHSLATTAGHSLTSTDGHSLTSTDGHSLTSTDGHSL